MTTYFLSNMFETNSTIINRINTVHYASLMSQYKYVSPKSKHAYINNQYSLLCKSYDVEYDSYLGFPH